MNEHSCEGILQANTKYIHYRYKLLIGERWKFWELKTSIVLLTRSIKQTSIISKLAIL